MNIIGLGLSAIDATAKFKLGTIAGDIGGNGPQKSFRYIKYVAGAAAVAGVAGEVAYYATVAVGDATGTVVTSDLSDSDSVGAGVLQASLTDGTYGWVQVKGPATLSIALTAGADGDALTPTGAGDGTLDVNIATAANTDICARALDASAKIIMCDFVC
tara:strand:- start:616 stop:1092 length:477 start_codon:yes stop_codon:yes gene_type:complete